MNPQFGFLRKWMRKQQYDMRNEFVPKWGVQLKQNDYCIGESHGHRNPCLPVLDFLLFLLLGVFTGGCRHVGEFLEFWKTIVFGDFRDLKQRMPGIPLSLIPATRWWCPQLCLLAWFHLILLIGWIYVCHKILASLFINQRNQCS